MNMRPRPSHAALFAVMVATVLLPPQVCIALAQTQASTAQSPAEPPHPTPPFSAIAASDKPLPEIKSLMQQVEDHQKAATKTYRDYTYRSSTTTQILDSHGGVKKTLTSVSENFWVDGTSISRVVTRDGKPLSADELKRQSDRIDQRIASAKEHNSVPPADQAPTKSKSDDEITFAQFLELGAFSNERRVSLNGRDTIAVDYTGDPKAKTHNRAEQVVRDLAGTAWVDEQDHVLSRVEGRFINSFKIAGGLFASVQKDTHFSMEQIKVNDEVWLLSRFEGQGSFHALLFFGFNGSIQIANSDYRKFRASSTILPGVAKVPDPAEPAVH